MECVGNFRLCVGDDEEETIEVAASSAQISNGEPSSIGYSAYCGAMCTPLQKNKEDHDPLYPTTMTTTTYPTQDDESHHPSDTEMLREEQDEEGRASPSVTSLAEEDSLLQQHPERGETHSKIEANFQSPPKVTHHVDARARAESRKAELETLRRMSLTQTKAKGLGINAAAASPSEMEKQREEQTLTMATFFEKQREQTLTQRKRNRDAKELLHKYRADDELVMKDIIKRTTSPRGDCSTSDASCSPRWHASTTSASSSAPAYATMSEIDSFFRQQQQQQQSWSTREPIKSKMEESCLDTYRDQEPLLNCSSAESVSSNKDHAHHPILLVSVSSEHIELGSCEWDDSHTTFSSIQKSLNDRMEQVLGSLSPLAAETPRGWYSKGKQLAAKEPLSPVQDFDSRTKALSERLALAIQDPLPVSPVSSILKLKQPAALALITQPSEEDPSYYADSIEITLVSMPDKFYKSLPRRKELTNQKFLVNAGPARNNKTVEKEPSRRSPRKDLILKGKRHRPKPAGSIPESQEWTEEIPRDNSSCRVLVDTTGTAKASTPTNNSTTHSEHKIQIPNSTKQTTISAADVDLVEKSSPDENPEAPSILEDGCKADVISLHWTMNTICSDETGDETAHLSRDSYIAIQASCTGLESVVSIPLDVQTLETIESAGIKDDETEVLQWLPSASSLETGTEIPGRTIQTDIPTVNSYKSSATAHIDACLRQDFAVLSTNESAEEALTPTSALNLLLRIDSRDECDECEGEMFDYTSALYNNEPSESNDTISIDPGLVGVDPSFSNETPAIAVVEEEKKSVYEDVTKDEACVFSILNNTALEDTSPPNPVDPDTHIFSILNAALEKTPPISAPMTMSEPVNEMIEDTADSIMMPESVDSCDSALASDDSFSIDHRSIFSGASSAVLHPAPVAAFSTPQSKDYTVPLAARAGFSPQNLFGYAKSSPAPSQPAMPRSRRKSGIVTPQARTPMKRPTGPTPSSARAASPAGGNGPKPSRNRRSDPYALAKRNRPNTSDPSPELEEAKHVLKRVPLYLRKPLQKKQKEKEVICCQRYDPHLHKSRAACERCLYWASGEEKEKFEEKGHHLRIMLVRGGCNQGCAVFPRETDEFPVRLCVKCYYDTHKQELNSSEWGR